MGAVSTCIIEVFQIFTFRTSDINDIITNIMGTVIGYFAAKWITRGFNQHVALNTKTRDFYMICGTVGLIILDLTLAVPIHLIIASNSFSGTGFEYK